MKAQACHHHPLGCPPDGHEPEGCFYCGKPLDQPPCRQTVKFAKISAFIKGEGPCPRCNQGNCPGDCW